MVSQASPALSPLLRTLLDATFRANPAYDLMVFDRLPEYQQTILGDIRNDPDMYGVAFLRDSASRVSKAIDRDTALLFFTLQSPGRLPAYVQHLVADQEGEDIARLVLDGIFEIEHNGSFVSGADAYTLLYGIAPLPDATSLPARLSRAALQYAQALQLNDVMKLAARLYFYHRQPLTPVWRQRFPSQAAIDHFLGLDSDAPIAALIEQHWARASSASGSKGWHIWRSRRTRSRSGNQTYKLYISPDFAQVPMAWQAALAVLASHAAHTIKIGCDVHGLLRPDKIVAYFGDFADLEAGASRLQSELGGCAAHGVPFTAAFGEEGLLSWGTDPPRDQQVLQWQASESWRVWICHRLAAALVQAREHPTETIEPWRFAMERLQFEGVDIQTWTPAATIWRAPEEM